MDDLNAYTDQGIQFIMDYGPKVIGALAVLILGLWLISMFTRILRKGFKKGKVDETLIPFLTSLVNWTLKAVLIISVASMVGIATTSFIAVLGAAGLAIGLALQGTLGNFAGGVMILLFKPYKIGDLIEAQGFLGVVEEIGVQGHLDGNFEGGQKFEELTKISQKDIPDSIIFYSQGITHIKSSAVLHIMKAIGGPWSLLYAGIYIPKFLRDFIYDYIAGNRYHWFGRQSKCVIPGKELNDINI